MSWWTIAVLAVFGVLLLAALLQSVTLRANYHVWGRPLASEEDFATRHFPREQQAIATKLRQLLAPYVPFNVARIAPDDRLVADLGVGERISRGMDAEEFYRAIQKEFGIELEEDDFYELTTFRSTVELVARKRMGTAFTTDGAEGADVRRG